MCVCMYDSFDVLQQSWKELDHRHRCHCPGECHSVQQHPFRTTVSGRWMRCSSKLLIINPSVFVFCLLQCLHGVSDRFRWCAWFPWREHLLSRCTLSLLAYVIAHFNRWCATVCTGELLSCVCGWRTSLQVHIAQRKSTVLRIPQAKYVTHIIYLLYCTGGVPRTHSCLHAYNHRPCGDRLSGRCRTS